MFHFPEDEQFFQKYVGRRKYCY